MQTVEKVTNWRSSFYGYTFNDVSTYINADSNCSSAVHNGNDQATHLYSDTWRD